MKSFCNLLLLTSLLILPTLVWGHGDAAHIMGTVIAMETDYLIVSTPKGEEVSLAFQPQTVFQEKGIHKKDARPKIGDRLFAEVTKEGLPEHRDWVATEITFATPKKKP